MLPDHVSESTVANSKFFAKWYSGCDLCFLAAYSLIDVFLYFYQVLSNKGRISEFCSFSCSFLSLFLFCS